MSNRSRTKIPWWRQALFIARKDVKYTFRARETWLWTFVMPVIFMFFIGTITSGGGLSGLADTPLALDIAPDAGFLADTLASRLEAEGFTLVMGNGGSLDAVADDLAPDGAARDAAARDGAARDMSEPDDAAPTRRLAIPTGFTDSLRGHRRVTLVLETAADDDDDGASAAEHAGIRIRRAVYGLLADVTVLGVGGVPLEPASLDSLVGEPRPLTLAVEPAGEPRDIPRGFGQAVPGILTMFTLLGLLTSGSVLLVIERHEGLMRRLASAPLGRGSIVTGKLAARLVQGAVQIGFAMLAGTVLFGMRWGDALPILFLVLLGYGTLCAALGLLLGNLARTEGQAIGIAVLASNLLAALGGCWWPIEITPRWMQQLALVLPTGWTMDALHRLVSFGMGPASVVPHLVVTALAATLAIVVLARTFRFE